MQAMRAALDAALEAADKFATCKKLFESVSAQDIYNSAAGTTTSHWGSGPAGGGYGAAW